MPRGEQYHQRLSRPSWAFAPPAGEAERVIKPNDGHPDFPEGREAWADDASQHGANSFPEDLEAESSDALSPVAHCQYHLVHVIIGYLVHLRHIYKSFVPFL